MAVFKQIKLMQTEIAQIERLEDGYDFMSLPYDSQKKIHKIMSDISSLEIALGRSICQCPMCSSQQNDMVKYSENYIVWVCTECYDKYLKSKKNFLLNKQ